MSEQDRGETNKALEWRNHSRLLQVEAIAKDAEASNYNYMELFPQELEALGILMSTRPIMLDLAIRRKAMGREAFFEAALRGLKLNSRMNYINGVLGGIKQGAELAASHNATVEIKIEEIELPIQIRRAFSSLPLQLQDAHHAGENEGCAHALTELQGDIPLLPRIRRDIAQTLMNLKPVQDGGMEGFLPTKVEGVDVRYFYPSDGESIALFPELSFLIKPLDS